MIAPTGCSDCEVVVGRRSGGSNRMVEAGPGANDTGRDLGSSEENDGEADAVD
jgi:hypothetical protein